MQNQEGGAQTAGTATNEEVKELLKEDIELARENNKLLKKLYRNAIIGFVAKTLIWLVLLGVPLFFLAPYIKPLFTLITTGETSGGGEAQSLFGFPNGEQLQELIDIYTKE